MDEIEKNFGDVKFVCMGGSPKRMHQFALYIQKLIGYKLPPGQSLANISEASDRYSMYKIGPVLSVNHGIGCPSMAILLHELIKLVHYAKCKDVTFFRLGTCGGVGAAPGTLVVTSEAVDGMFRPEYRTVSYLIPFLSIKPYITNVLSNQYSLYLLCEKMICSLIIPSITQSKWVFLILAPIRSYIYVTYFLKGLGVRVRARLRL